MLNTLKKFLSVILIVCLLCSMIIVNVSAFSINSDESQNMQTDIGDMNIKSTNSFGNLLTSEFEQEAEKQEQNNGINIFSVEVEGNKATVEFETLQDSMLIVAIYDESGVEMIASGNTEVTKEDITADVIIDIETMPEYFYLKAFLVDDEVYRPLCTAYESPNYTQEMQEFFSKTTDDFESDKVLNLDDDKTNNFAVYSDETKIIEQSESNNQVTSVDEENKKYVIEKADISITSLKEGDIFAYNYTEDNTLIVKVKYISANDSTVTIYGDDVEIEEVFEYVKIDSTADTSNAYYDPSTCDDGITYVGTETEKYNDKSSPSVLEELEGSAEYTHSFLIDETVGDVNAKGGLEFWAKASAKVYLSLSYQYVELKVDYSASFSVTISGKFDLKLSIGYFGISPVAGVYIDFTPSFVIKGSTIISLSSVLSGTLGMRASDKNGIQNISTNPKLKPEIKVEGTFYFGILLEPRIKILENVIVAKMGGELGAEIFASLSDVFDNGEKEIHECTICISGSVYVKASLSFEIIFLNCDNLKFGDSIPLINDKITDFYYSSDFNEFAFTTCPHYKYKVTVTVKDENGNLLNWATVNNEYTTNAMGKVDFYLPAGTHRITAKCNELSGSKRITIDGKPTSITIILKENNFVDNSILSLGWDFSGFVTEDGDLYMWGRNDFGQLGDGTTTDRHTPKKILSNVKSVKLGEVHSAAITENGDLYMWGDNDCGQLGNGTTTDSYTPIKIMSNVKDVSLGEDYSAAVTENGDLYMWGDNDCGQLGDGTTIDKYIPTKIINNVKVLSLGSLFSGVITENGDLYMWGNNGFGQLGDGTTTHRHTPQKIMSNVKFVSLGSWHSGAITENGDLYMWGDNLFGELGNGTTGDRYTPTKVMSNVKTLSLGVAHTGAITQNGDLYMWGANTSGELGDGTTMPRHAPIKTMSNINYIELGRAFSGAITDDGDLYMWGYNEFGQLGNGKTTNSIVPVKISIPTSYNLLKLDDEVNSSIKTVTFSDLLPNEIYNFYSMKTKDAVNLFENSNLLYIDQVITDENGNLSISYIPNEEYNNAVNFVVPLKQIDLSNAEVKMDNLLYSGETQYISPVVTLDGRILVEGTDYDLCGDYYANDVGNYTVTIVGRGLYNGEVRFNYSVLSSDIMIGDVNNDGIINILDATLVQMYVAKFVELNDEQKYIADIDKNGIINTIDATQIQKYIVKLIPSLG